MYILSNAFQNILRNKGRNFLLGAIIFVIITSTVVALMINNTTGSIIEDYQDRFTLEVRLTPNMQRIRDEAVQSGAGRVRPALTSEQYMQFAESDLLSHVEYTAETGVVAPSLTSLDAALGGSTNMMGAGSDELGFELLEFHFNLRGNHFEEFESGDRALSEGSRMPAAQNEAIISEDLALLNNIEIGDTIDLEGELANIEVSETADASAQTTPLSWELTVVGIYYDLTDEHLPTRFQTAHTNRRNEILTTFDTVYGVSVPGFETGMRLNAVYFLNSPDDLPAFEAEIRAMGLPETFEVGVDSAGYQQMLGPVEGLRSISVTFMIIVLAFGSVIIALLSTMAIRERKYEIGVLRAMGMKKHALATGLWTEMLVLTVVCLIVGLSVGTLVAQPVTNFLLSGQIASLEAANAAAAEMGGMGQGMMMRGNMFSASTVSPLSYIDISLGIDTALQIIGISLGLASLAALIAIARITKFEPIKILMERN